MGKVWSLDFQGITAAHSFRQETSQVSCTPPRQAETRFNTRRVVECFFFLGVSRCVYTLMASQPTPPNVLPPEIRA